MKRDGDIIPDGDGTRWAVFALVTVYLNEQRQAVNYLFNDPYGGGNFKDSYVEACVLDRLLEAICDVLNSEALHENDLVIGKYFAPRTKIEEAFWMMIVDQFVAWEMYGGAHLKEDDADA